MGPGGGIDADGADEKAQREHERLGKEEREEYLVRLKIDRQKGEHSSPYARGVDSEEQRVAK